MNSTVAVPEAMPLLAPRIRRSGRRSWFQSLRMQIGVAVIAIFAVLLGSIGYTLHALNLRGDDYLVLNLVGQLRGISQNMVAQSVRYLAKTEADYNKYNHRLSTYGQDLKAQTALYERILRSLDSREVDAGLSHVGSGHITGNWGAQLQGQLQGQLDQASTEWAGFRDGLRRSIGTDAQDPNLFAAAEYVDTHGSLIMNSSDQLATSFQSMMESQFQQIRRFQWIAIAIGVACVLVVLSITQLLVVTPLHVTVRGFARVANGDFKHKIAIHKQNEVGAMTAEFNKLTDRLKSIFRLTDRINQGDTLDQTLRFVYEDFQGFVPLDWVGVFYQRPDHKFFYLERQFGDGATPCKEGENYDAGTQAFRHALHRPFSATLDTGGGGLGDLGERLRGHGMRAALYLPLRSHGKHHAVMVFASSSAHYQEQHVDFLANIGANITHVLEKTVVMESLVTSAVQGLAKLAESRDPETGDHLVRMSLYSALIAEELSKEGPYVAQVTPAYVRDVYQFAPMHDIGKVGVRDSVLLKQGVLDAEERHYIEQHPTIGGQVLRRCEAQMQIHGHSLFQTGIEIAECHHEKFDGSGYPNHLSGSGIPLSARIVAAADVFDALTSKRPYKEAWPVEKALGCMRAESGKHFDPVVVAAMERALPRMLDVYERLKHV